MKEKKRQVKKERLVKQLRNDVIRDLKSLINGVETLADGIERDYPTFLKFENEETYLKILKDFYNLENIYSFLNENFLDKLFLSLSMFKNPEKFKTNPEELIGSILKNLMETYKTKQKTNYQSILNTLDTLDLELLVEISKINTDEYQNIKEDIFEIAIHTKHLKNPLIVSCYTYNKEYFKQLNKNNMQVEEAYKRFLKENLEQKLFEVLPLFIKQYKLTKFSIFSTDKDLTPLEMNDICDKLNKLV